MNLGNTHGVVFTNNLTKAYRAYQSNSQKDTGWCALTQTQYLKTRLDRYADRNNQLRESLHKQNEEYLQSSPIKKVETQQDAFVIYFEAHNFITSLAFDGAGTNLKTRNIKITEEELWAQAVSSKENITAAYKYINYLSYTQVPLMGDLRSEWDIRCHETLLSQIQALNSQDFEVLLFYITLLSRGIFFLGKHIGNDQNHKNWVHDKDLAYSIIFTEAFNTELGIVGAVLPERIPVCHPQNQQLIEFQYRQYLLLHQLWDIDSILKQNKNYQLHLSYEDKRDYDRYQTFTYYNVQLRHDAPKQELHLHVQFKHLFKGDFLSYQIRPLKIFKWMVKETPFSTFRFDEKTRRWIYNPLQSQSAGNYETQAKEAKVQAKVLNQMDKENTSKKLVQILDLMPTLQIKLSDVQKKVVASNQNLLCLGRSGTGKTTTSVLRLFAQEVLYSILKKSETKPELRQQVNVASDPQKKRQLIKAKDLEKNTGMKMVFITASPVLTNEVRRFYSSIKGKLLALLKTRDAKIKERKLLAKKQETTEEQKEHFEDISEKEAQQILDEAVAEQSASDKKVVEGMNDFERQEMLDFIKTEERNLVDDLAIESEMNLPNSFDDLKPWQFPLFVTVKRLIYMMDACLAYSFFSRDNNNSIIGLDQNLGWHNEAKGVMMINHYFKESIDYDQQLAKFGKEILEIDKDAEIINDEEEPEDDLGSNFKIIFENTKDGNKKDGVKVNQFTNRTSSNSSKYFIEKQQLAFEVDYDIFETKFWPKIANRRSLIKLSPTLVWTEIYSVIKGGMKSGTYYMGYLPKQIYVSKEGSDFLNYNERRLIYYLFLEYEKWKSTQNAYDFMDVVNHLQKRLWYGDTLKRMSIDYLMVDEVQDLTPKTLQTLLRLTSHKVFFAGDTAQTIAKGVGARFLDLRNLFTQLDFKIPQIIQLTKNYRSHGRILDLANSVVTLIELLFPKTIDRLVKEDSDQDGLKPLVIMPLDNYHLRTFFAGTTVTQHSGGQQIAAPQFGCNQVIIVRDQSAKEYIPEVFRNMLCLTVYEAKGLEFDDVILYNFFHLGDVQKSQWKLLNDIELEEVKRVKVNEALLMDFDCLDAEKSNIEELMRELKKQERGEDCEVEYETEIGLKLKKHRDEVYRKFSMLCVEMKFLYVAITRPKRRLIIYDDAIDGRKPIQSYWEKLNVVEVVTKDQISHPETLNESVRNIFMSGQMVNERSSVEQWRLQGIKLFKKKYYEAAIKCFENSDDQDLVKRCQAYREADLGTSKMSNADSDAWRVQVFKHITKTEKRRLLKDVKKQRIQASKNFEVAGNLFEQIKMLKHAASCFFTAKNYARAGLIFESLNQFGQAAECYLMTQQLSKAAQLYERASLVSKAIDCYESNGDWEQLLHCLHRNKDFFKNEERQALINKYVPVALNSLYKLYSQSAENGEDIEDQEGEQNKGKMQEMKIRMKYQKKVSQAVIAEEEEISDSEEEEVATEENPQAEDDEKQEDDLDNANKVVTIEEEKKEEEELEDVNSDIEVMEEEGYDLLEEVFQLKKHKSTNENEQQVIQDSSKVDSSYEVIDTASNASKLLKPKKEEEKDIISKDDFEHLSQYDPDDEFLRSNKSVSIIDSILSKKSISQTSDFSIISNAKSQKVQSVISIISSKKQQSVKTIAFVESNRDIYAEDVITQKIIYYISLFSEDVSSHLQKIRSKKVLFSNTVDQQTQEDLFILDLDDVDSNFVNLILDVLEYYELFRLCLMLCNRYHMSERLGRYLVSVCSKYSNMHLHRFNIKLLRNNLTLNEQWLQRQRFASIISHEALHNVFTLLEPSFLTIKGFDENDPSLSLGIETYRTMMDLGFWKKLVYIGIDSRRALELCYKFFDRQNFEVLQQSLTLDDKSTKLVAQWRNRLVLRDFWFETNKRLRSINLVDEKATTVIQTCLDEFPLYDEQDKKVVADMTSVYKWMYGSARKITDFMKPGQKITTEEQEQKLKEKIRAINEEENNQVYDILESLGLFDSKNESFQKKFMALQFAALPNTQYFAKFLENIRTYYDKDSVESLIQVYIKQIQRLNLDQRYTHKDEDDSLYSIFQVSSLHETNITDSSNQSLFKHYNDGQYLLMSVHSPLLKDISTVQLSMDAFQTNIFLARKLTELRPRYFQLKNFKTAFLKEYKDFVAQFDQKKAYLNQNNEKGNQAGCFIIDMDAQFMMVPKAWINKLLIIKLLNLCVSLAHELNFLHSSQAQPEDEEEFKEDTSMVDEIDKNFDQMKTIQKVNQLAVESKSLHESFINDIERTEMKIMNQVLKNGDFVPLVTSYRQKINFNPLKFNQITNSAERTLYRPLPQVQNEFYLCFDFGIFYKKKEIRNKSEIIALGIKKFRDAMIIKKKRQDLDDEDHWLARNLRHLIKSFANFVIVDQYEIMLELIKGELKCIKRDLEQSPNDESIKLMKWLLQKFMIALDIHFYMKHGSIKSACESIFSFLETFSKYLNNRENAKLIQTAFFLLQVTRFGQCYLPDYALIFLDITYSLDHQQVNYPPVDILQARNNAADREDLENEVHNMFESDERTVIEKVFDKGQIEKIDDDTLYVRAIQKVVNILIDINSDERSAYFKSQYIQMFNLLMSAVVNDGKKSQKVIELLSKGFTLISKGSYDEYFQHSGLIEFNYSNSQGFNELYKQFRDCEKEYKHQFFAPYTFGGHQLCFVDVRKSQGKDVQEKISKIIDKAFFKESKTLAQHLYLGMLLKRKIRQRRHIYLAIRRARENFTYEDQALSIQLNIEQMLTIEQIPSRQLLDLLMLLQRKHQELRQFIVCKLAVNSLDIHYILAKANDLHTLQTTLMQQTLSFITDKGLILKHFEEIQEETGESEISQLLNQTRLRFLQIESEINLWMQQKAEPNLVEVERKSTKFKIKWESLKIYDSRAQLKAFAKKMEIIASGASK